MTQARSPRKAIDPHDLLEIDAHLDEDEVLLRDTVRRFANERLAPSIAEWFDEGGLPRELALEFGKLGVLGMHLEGYGCAGSSATAYGLVCREIEAIDSGLRSFVSVQGSLAMFAIWRWGSEEQKQQWLPSMAEGTLLGCFGLTEPDHGSDPAGMRTNARRDGSDWVLNGSKMWITNGSIADVAIVWAQADDGITGFLVEKGTPGFTTTNIERKMSLRASVTSELHFDDCRLPDAARLPEANGLRGPLACLNEARFGILWGSNGAARTAYESALDYAKSREQFGQPIAGFQLTQQKLVEMALAVNAGYLLALHLGRMKDAGTLLPQHVSVGKLSNVRSALEVCRSARTVLGANGITLEYPIIRHMNNLESVLTYEGTSEIHLLTLGQAITGIPAFR